MSWAMQQLGLQIVIVPATQGPQLHNVHVGLTGAAAVCHTIQASLLLLLRRRRHSC
jgi:hypothetical protein